MVGHQPLCYRRKDQSTKLRYLLRESDDLAGSDYDYL